MAKCLDCSKVFATYGGTKKGDKCPFCKSENLDVSKETK